VTLLKLFINDPIFMLPRLILNNKALAFIFRSKRSIHIGASLSITKDLQKIGYTNVYTVSNFCLFTDEDSRQSDELFIEKNDKHLIFLGYIGHSFPVKGIYDLLAAFKKAVLVKKNLRLVLALSSDGNSQKVGTMIRKYKIEKNVIQTGLVAVKTLLNKLDCLVLPYRSIISTTIYPSLLLEANLSHCPLLISRVKELEPILNFDSQSLYIFRAGERVELESKILMIPPKKDNQWQPILKIPSDEEKLNMLMNIYSKTD